MPLQETLKYSKAGLAQPLVGSLGPGARQVLFESSKHLWRAWGLILNAISPFLSSCWGFSFARGHGVSFFGGIQYSPVNKSSTASCNLGVLTGEDEHKSFYSAILKYILKEINFKYSLEELILKLKVQYFGHLIGRVD